ncbi:MAG: hypothetical protein H6Q37_1789 [Chloroflexi bacterium]|nr:hypothetical protein [Chloroflexota bacterium]
MRKPILLIVLIFALALSACAGLTPPPVATPVQPTAADQAAAASSTQVVAEPTAAGTPAKPECRVDTSSTSDPSLADRYPKVGNTDWSQGLDTAYVQIIEYSDFQ